MSDEQNFELMQQELNKKFLETIDELKELKVIRTEREFWKAMGVYAYTQKKHKLRHNLHHVSTELLLKINALYGVSVDYLIGRSNKMFCSKIKV